MQIDLVRDSHRFAEFTPEGVSRGSRAGHSARLAIAWAEQGLLDRCVVELGRAQLSVGHDLLGALQHRPPALKLVHADARPALSFRRKRRGNGAVSKTGARIWV
jgi:hypothetical protein